ncbi:MAG TPA: SDR family oxidoreductase [Solirubrobacteraceae bacterium]|nr:SDR family oxidoreductase [Solirubrobacteraceae bacterium]
MAVVTGGSSGIGLATAAACLEAGYDVVIAARDAGRLALAESELGSGGRVLACPTDVGDEEAVARLIAAATERFGRVDALINAHGIVGAQKPVDALSPSDWEDVFATNLFGAVRTTRLALPALRLTRGAVLNIASLSAYQAEPNLSAYAASKAALVSFTRSAACELAADGIRVNAIAPGWVLTAMAESFFAQAGLDDGRIGSNMQGRAAQPEEIASVALFLIGRGASHMTGQSIVVDGGHGALMTPLGPPGGLGGVGGLGGLGGLGPAPPR